jgi:hypothetical protein
MPKTLKEKGISLNYLGLIVSRLRYDSRSLKRV